MAKGDKVSLIDRAVMICSQNTEWYGRLKPSERGRWPVMIFFQTLFITDMTTAVIMLIYMHYRH